MFTFDSFGPRSFAIVQLWMKKIEVTRIFRTPQKHIFLSASRPRSTIAHITYSKSCGRCYPRLLWLCRLIVKPKVGCISEPVVSEGTNRELLSTKCNHLGNQRIHNRARIPFHCHYVVQEVLLLQSRRKNHRIFLFRSSWVTKG